MVAMYRRRPFQGEAAMRPKRGVGRYLQPDEAALVAQHFPMVRRVVRRYFSCAGGFLSYEDLEQEAAIALVQAIRSFDPVRHESLEAFVVRLIRWRVLDYVRRQIRQRRAVWRTPPNTPAESDGDSEEALPLDAFRPHTDTDAAPTEFAALLAMNMTQLHEAMSQLSQADQRLLTLHWDRGLTYEGIAKLLGSTKPTIGRRHQHLLRVLAEALGTRDPKDGNDHPRNSDTASSSVARLEDRFRERRSETAFVRNGVGMRGDGTA